MPVFAGRPDLYRRFREGDRAALETVYRACVAQVTAAVKQTCRWQAGPGQSSRGCPHWCQVADWVQEVFARAFAPRARAAFDGERAYGPYLAAIARNVVLDNLRHRGREIPTDWLDLEQLAPAHEDEADASFMDVLAGHVRRYVHDLEPRMRAVHEARYARGLSQQEAASELGLTRQRVRTLEAHLHAGLRRTLARDRYRDLGQCSPGASWPLRATYSR
jgi:RNA polymerase sigma factor (sigma-70 family)